MQKINALGITRLAMHGDEEYRRQVTDLVDQVELLEYVKPSDEENLRRWGETVEGLKTFLDNVKSRMGR